jgi:replication factor C small subunit
MTANFKSKLIAPLHSRCANFDFTIPKTEVKDLVLRFFSRLKTILDAEGVEINKEVLARITQKFFPDFRRTLNELQRHTKDGVLTEDILASLSDESFMSLAAALKAKDYKAVKQWVVESNDSSEAIFRKVFDNADLFVQPQSIPELVVLIASYQYKHAFVADAQINILAFFVEAMVSLEFK